MAKAKSRFLFWSIAVILVAAIALAYLRLEAALNRWAESTVAAPESSEPRSEEPVGQPLELARAEERETVLPDHVGIGWPTLLGPNGDCTSRETGLNWSWDESGPPEKWRVPAGDGYTSPVVLGSRLILFHRVEDQEVVDCLDAETGEAFWSQSWPATYECPFNHSSGPYSAPVLENDRVYAMGAGGRLVCLNLEDGLEVWCRNVHEDYQVEIEVWPVSASPVVEGDLLIVNAGGRKTNAGVVAFDKRTGDTVWTATDDGMSCSTPRGATIHDKRFLFVWAADTLVSLNPEDGHVYWQIPFAAKNYEAAHGTPPLIVGDIVMVSGYQTGNLCLRILADGSYEELWRDKRELLDSQYKNLLHLDGHVCGFSMIRKRMRCLDLKTGEMQWEWRSKITAGSTIGVDAHYLVVGLKGRLAAVDMTPIGIEEIAMTVRPVIQGPALAYPALHNGLLYIRSDTELLCVDLRREAE